MNASQHTIHDSELPVELPQVNRITLDHPWRWIAAGWWDMRSSPVISLTYGLLFLVASFLVSGLAVMMKMYFFVPALAAGFFLVSPLLAMGLYEVSRCLSRGESPTFFGTLMVWRRARFNLLAMGLILMLAFVVWVLLSNLVFALFFHGVTPAFDNALSVLFFSGQSPVFMAAGMLVGGVLAFLVFCISVISVPMIIDRDADVMSAVLTSLRCVRENLRPMLLWAALIVMFVGLGLITLFIGLVIFMPLVGHASWHAYSDLVALDENS